MHRVQTFIAYIRSAALKCTEINQFSWDEYISHGTKAK